MTTPPAPADEHDAGTMSISPEEFAAARADAAAMLARAFQDAATDELAKVIAVNRRLVAALTPPAPSLDLDA